MNTKAVAMVAVIVMLAAGAAVAIQTVESDADVVNTTPGVINLTKGDTAGHNISILTDEHQYQPYGYKAEWYVVNNTNDSKTQEGLEALFVNVKDGNLLGTSKVDKDGHKFTPSGNGVTINDIVFALSQRTYSGETSSNVGEYNLNVSANAGAKNTHVAVMCKISVTLGSSSYEVEPLFYLYNIGVADPSGPVSENNDWYATEGVNFNQKIDLDGVTEGDYNWYAVGLPDGLSMSSDGTISGTPSLTAGSNTDHDGMGKSYSVTAIGSSKGTSGDVSKTVTVTFTIYVKEGSTGGIVLTLDGKGVSEINRGKIYAVENGANNVNLTVSQGQKLPFDVLTVKTVQTDDSDTTASVYVIDGSNDTRTEFDIDVGGTGMYRIYVTAVVGGEPQTDYVDLYVLGSLDNVEAHIIVSGA